MIHDLYDERCDDDGEQRCNKTTNARAIRIPQKRKRKSDSTHDCPCRLEPGQVDYHCRLLSGSRVAQAAMRHSSHQSWIRLRTRRFSLYVYEIMGEFEAVACIMWWCSTFSHLQGRVLRGTWLWALLSAQLGDMQSLMFPDSYCFT